MGKVLIEITNTGDGHVASVHGRPELHGEGSTISIALRNLANAVEYMNDDITAKGPVGEPEVTITEQERHALTRGEVSWVATEVCRRTGVSYTVVIKMLEKFRDEHLSQGSYGISGLSGTSYQVPELNMTEKMEVECGRKLQAVKLIKERLGIGLKEGKDAVDAYAEKRALSNI